METQNKLQEIAAEFNVGQFQTLHEEMSFSEYLDRAYKNPKLIRTAYQRMYDMIMSAGTETYTKYRQTITHYKFFNDAEIPIFGLDPTLMDLVQFIRGAAGGYGPEKRVLLLHGPVGSSKSTICRRLKRGLENYSYGDDGAWYSFKWVNLPVGQDGIYTHKEDMCPMHEEPLKLIPIKQRNKVVSEINEVWYEQHPEADRNKLYTLRVEGELDPRCQKFMEEMLKRYNGDWNKVVSEHIRVVRMAYSEANRTGIATFQPKDEKNQDATELTGDINYAKLPHFGTDSDPRAFNFDGEFCVANRGMCEFIEMLKLADEFLYDLLGATQERSIKPKKFAQISIDEVLIGHSVHGETPIPHLYNGVLDVLPISELANKEINKLLVFSVNLDTKKVELTRVKNVFSHKFEGDWIVNNQDSDSVTTTPNHSVYKKNEDGSLETFYPGDDDTTEIATVELPLDDVLNYPKTKRWEEFFAAVAV